jgi:ABC-type Fe3+/spermidine/putrescine transport system ATPase subunit
MKYLEVSGIRFSRGNFTIHVSLALERGKTGVILGPSGCGKTTLLRCIAGLEQAEEGIVSIGGKNITEMPTEKRNIGFIFQDLALFDHLTGRENIEFGLRLRQITKAEASIIIDALANKLKIASLLDRKPFFMSGGEKQRLAFARAIAVKPGILLMDEPLSSLDAPLRRELRTYLKTTLSGKDITALHVTHDVEEALELGDEIFLMNKGRILARGNPRSIYANPPDAWCVRFLGLGALLPVKGIEDHGTSVVTATPFGRLSCARQACRADMADIERGEAFFFIPWRAATSTGIPVTIGPVTPRPPADVIDVEVEKIVFQGSYQRIVLHPWLPETNLLPAETWDGGEGFEMELELDSLIVRGERLRLSIDTDKCAILPLHCAGDSSGIGP